MLCSDQVPTEIEQILNRSMSTDKSLGLPHRLESPHPSLSDAGRFMRLLGPIILMLFGTVDHVRDQFAMGNTVTA